MISLKEIWRSVPPPVTAWRLSRTLPCPGDVASITTLTSARAPEASGIVAAEALPPSYTRWALQPAGRLPVSSVASNTSALSPVLNSPVTPN
ncbi:MAG: hypothetical protein IPP62_15885 [bacterium]|nr:hypothetical protein [bacterium]